MGHPQRRSSVVRRNGVDLRVDKSAHVRSDRSAIRATMRVAWESTHSAGIQEIALNVFRDRNTPSRYSPHSRERTLSARCRRKLE